LLVADYGEGGALHEVLQDECLHGVGVLELVYQYGAPASPVVAAYVLVGQCAQRMELQVCEAEDPGLAPGGFEACRRESVCGADVRQHRRQRVIRRSPLDGENALLALGLDRVAGRSEDLLDGLERAGLPGVLLAATQVDEVGQLRSPHRVVVLERRQGVQAGSPRYLL